MGSNPTSLTIFFTMTNPERIALIDMDGTIADYENAMRVEYDKLIAPGEMDYYEASRKYGRDEWPSHLWNRMDVIKRRSGFWRYMPRHQLGFEIVDVLREYDFHLNIATQGPSTKALAWSEKFEWVREVLPDADMHITENKSLLYGKILVDDWPPFAWGWLANRPRGLVVMPAAHYNEDVQKSILTGHAQILRYSYGMQDELRKRIEEVI